MKERYFKLCQHCAALIMNRAVTSAGSSELIAVSSLCTYDIYRTYINPDASEKKKPQRLQGRHPRLWMFHGIVCGKY